MRRIAKIIFDFFEVHLASFIFLILIFSIVVQVFSRYVFDHPIPPLFELSIYSFVWVIYLGAPLAKRYRKHIRFDILYRKLPRKAQLFIEIFFDILTNIILLIILIPTIKYASWSYKIKASVLKVSYTYLILCFPIFIVLLFIHNSVWIYYYILEILGKKVPSMENPPWQ